jgi:aerobic-type carbon monoxide dehydrogenase small subunit (CoxS/CutS family)
LEEKKTVGEKGKNSARISRREFLKDAGLIVGGATVSSVALLNACGKEAGTTVTVTVPATGGSIITPVVQNGDSSKIALTVNKRAYNVAVETGWTLQYLLHDIIGWTSIKDMCFGYGACGSCAAIVNGKPLVTCMVLAAECDGAVIETAEGIAEAKHPLVDAYVLNHCMQCGYCTPGFIVTAKALLDHNSKPGEADVRDALAGNICRCGTYPQHILAVAEASGKKGGA